MPISIITVKRLISQSYVGSLNTGFLSATSAVVGTGYLNNIPTPFYSENFSTGIGAFVDGGGDVPWTRVTDEGNGDLFSIRSGVIGNQSTSIVQVTQTTTQQSTLLSYDYKTSTEGGYDFLFIEVNGIVVKRYSGTNPWTTDRVFIHGIGSKVIRFIYYKDSSAIGGTDQVWIDNVKLINHTEGFVVNTPSLFSGSIVSLDSLVGKGLSTFDDVYINRGLTLLNDVGDNSITMGPATSGQGGRIDLRYGGGKDGITIYTTPSQSVFRLQNPFTLSAPGTGIYMTVGSSSEAGIAGNYTALQIPGANTRVRFGQYATVNPTSLFAVTGETTFTGTVAVTGSLQIQDILTLTPRTTTPTQATTLTGSLMISGSGVSLGLYVYTGGGIIGNGWSRVSLG